MNNVEPAEFSLGLFLEVFSLGMIIATSIWMAIDAKANRIPTTQKPYSVNNGALAWFISSIALWIATFPYYLIRRRQVLEERRQAVAAAAAAAAAVTTSPLTIALCGGNSGQTEFRERKRTDLSGYYDTAQICRNGHVVTGHYQNCPMHRQEFCDRCGESTMIKCESCGTCIRGDYDVPGVAVVGEYLAPSYCHACGKSYPWTLQKLQTAKELVDELVELDEADKQILKQSLDELVRGTPKIETASFRFKKILRKVGQESFEAVKGAARDLVSEAVKKSLDSAEPVKISSVTEFFTNPADTSVFSRENGGHKNGHTETGRVPRRERKLILPL